MAMDAVKAAIEGLSVTLKRDIREISDDEMIDLIRDLQGTISMALDKYIEIYGDRPERVFGFIRRMAAEKKKDEAEMQIKLLRAKHDHGPDCVCDELKRRFGGMFG